jgi:hypothetical protein
MELAVRRSQLAVGSWAVCSLPLVGRGSGIACRDSQGEVTFRRYMGCTACKLPSRRVRDPRLGSLPMLHVIFKRKADFALRFKLFRSLALPIR